LRVARIFRGLVLRVARIFRGLVLRVALKRS
jgi:hypothetical protein